LARSFSAFSSRFFASSRSIDCRSASASSDDPVEGSLGGVASVAIQISGTFGSRQEEAQRLGRILRPKEKNSHFYTIVTSQTVEEEFAANRQKFLAEQGYEYSIIRWEEDSGLLMASGAFGSDAASCGTERLS